MILKLLAVNFQKHLKSMWGFAKLYQHCVWCVMTSLQGLANNGRDTKDMFKITFIYKTWTKMQKETWCGNQWKQWIVKKPKALHGESLSEGTEVAALIMVEEHWSQRLSGALSGKPHWPIMCHDAVTQDFAPYSILWEMGQHVFASGCELTPSCSHKSDLTLTCGIAMFSMSKQLKWGDGTDLSFRRHWLFISLLI